MLMAGPGEGNRTVEGSAHRTGPEGDGGGGQSHRPHSPPQETPEYQESKACQVLSAHVSHFIASFYIYK